MSKNPCNPDQDGPPLLGDGAYGTLLMRHTRAGEAVDELCLRAPNVVIDAHAAYLDAGARVLQTNSFLVWQASERRQHDLYRAALDCAGTAAQMTADAQISATLGPAGTEPHAYYRHLEFLLEQDVPSIVCETVTSRAVATAFLNAWREVAQGVSTRARLSLSIDPSTPMASWRWIGELDLSGGVSVGLNCCTGPAGLRQPLALLVEYGVGASFVPSAGIPETFDDDGLPVHPLAAAEWAQLCVEEMEGLDVTLVGGCCGTTPDHVSALAAALA